MRKGIAAILGIGLLTAWLLTGKEGLPEEDQKIYEEALLLQEQVDELGFEGFSLADYPVAVYDGNADYVFYKGEVTKRAPVLETFAGTAYPVEDHFEVIVPTLEQLDSLMSLTSGAEGMISGSGYGDKEQKATIWHEAFHAYQLTNFAILGDKILAEDMRKELDGTRDAKEEKGEKRENEENESENNESEMSQEKWIVREIDEKAGIRSKLEQEMKLLKRAVDEINAGKADIDEIRNIVLEYSVCRKERMSEMSEEAKEAEIRCELMEGTAYYVEGSVYRMLSGEKGYQERYLDDLDVYEEGRSKYYRTGSAKCLLLDQLDPEWKKTFDFTRGLDEVIEEYGDEEGKI